MLHWDALKLPKFRISASSLTDVVPPQWRTSIHCANAYSALASGKPLCTGVTYNDELLPQIKQCARCLSRDRLFAMCDVNNDFIIFCDQIYIIIDQHSIKINYLNCFDTFVPSITFMNVFYCWVYFFIRLFPFVKYPIDGRFLFCSINEFLLVRQK